MSKEVSCRCLRKVYSLVEGMASSEAFFEFHFTAWLYLIRLWMYIQRNYVENELYISWNKNN